MYEHQSGSIAYNGLPRGNLKLSTLRSVIGDKLPEEQIFDGSVIANIAMGRERATFENAAAVAK